MKIYYYKNPYFKRSFFLAFFVLMYFSKVSMANIIITPAQDLTVQCDQNTNMTQLSDWLANNGGATGYSTCGSIIWDNDYMDLMIDCGSSGSATVTFTAVDTCGNYSETSATFTIIDTIAPVITVPGNDMTAYCGPQAGYYPILTAWLNYHAFSEAEDCNNITWTNDFENLYLDCFVEEVVFTATDECGNSTSFSAVFTVLDTLPPYLDYQAQDIVVQCDGNGNTSDLNSWLAIKGGAYATDYCGNVTWTNDFTGLSYDSNSCGSATVTFTASDECGNSVSSTATFSIQDTVAPFLSYPAQDMTVQCDTSNNSSLNAWLASNGGADIYENCGDVTWSNDFSGISNGCGSTGSATVTFTATDNCGNSTSTTATFTIVDTTPPTISGGSSLYIVCDGTDYGPAVQNWVDSLAGATAIDNCGTVSWSNNYSGSYSACDGASPVTFTATDECGNTSFVTYTITVEDLNPVITVPGSDMIVQCDGSGNIAQYNDWLDNHAGGMAEGVCAQIFWYPSVFPETNNCGMTKSIPVVFYAYNDCEIDASFSANFIIVDTIPPVIDTPAQNLVLDCNGSDYSNLINTWLASNGGASASDVCGNVTWSNDYSGLSGGCGSSGSATVTFTATDECGNTSTTSATISVEDTTPPSIDQSAQDLTAECDGSDISNLINTWLSSNGGASASDVCGNVTWSNDYSGLSGGCGSSGSATVTFTATDECGNTSTTSATISITDVVPFILSPAQDLTVECDGAGNTSQLNDWLDIHGGASVSNNCSDIFWTHDCPSITQLCANTGFVTVTFTATDECGTSQSTTATFTIEDTTPPNIIQQASDMTVECYGWFNYWQFLYWLYNLGGAVADDTCGSVWWSFEVLDDTEECCGTGSTTVAFIVTDECANSQSSVATFTIGDTTPPIIWGGNNIFISDCTYIGINDGTCNGGNKNKKKKAKKKLKKWLKKHAKAHAYDYCCNDITWSHDFVYPTDTECNGLSQIDVTFYAEDACGNVSSIIKTIYFGDDIVETNPSGENNLSQSNNEDTETRGSTKVEDFSIFPNPTTGKIVVDIHNAEKSIKGEFYILSLDGKVLMSGDLNSNNLSIDISELIGGMYFMKLRFGKKSLIKKVLKIN